MLGDWIRKLVGRPRVEEVEELPARWEPQGEWFMWELARRHGYASPYGDKLIRAMRQGWDKPFVGRASDMSAMMNVVGLWWQPFDGEIIDGEWAEASPLHPLGPLVRFPNTIPTIKDRSI